MRDNVNAFSQRPRWRFALALLWLISATTALAASDNNVDLATVPPRQTVQLTIYNAEDLTLVRETRALTFKQGINPLQFSWANTLIDPTSVELRFLNDDSTLAVLDTTFPHDKREMLYWNVQAEADIEATVEISYFTSGLTWSADYTAIANPDETSLDLESFVKITNSSGEEYEEAQVRLVVGTINLVEQIAQLARIPVNQVGQLRAEERMDYRNRAARQLMESDVAMSMAMPAAAPAPAPKAVDKEGLGEYFIYTIEGTETIPDGWSKRLRSFSAADVPLETLYRYRQREYGDQLVRLYRLQNDEEAGLGTTPLPDGAIRLFRRLDDGNLQFLTARTLNYVPIGDEIELNLGPNRDVVFELVLKRVRRDNIILQLRGANLYRPLEGFNWRIEPNAQVAGWDDRELYAQRIDNFTDRAIRVEVRRTFAGDVTFASQLDPTLYDASTVEYVVNLAPGERRRALYEVVTRQGYSRQQNRIELEQRAVASEL